MERTSTNSPPRLSARHVTVLLVAACLSAALYLIVSARTYGIGFPLDDSWIHLTYARNLALRGEWAFQPGHLSAGSTAPLWTFLLAIGFWLRLGPYVWTYLTGELALVALAVLAETAARRLREDYRPRWPWIGLFFIAEWHLQWAALSGMETILQALLMTAVLVMLLVGSRRYALMGILTGLSIWVRPDGITLLGPVALTILLVEKTLAQKSGSFARYLVGLCVLFGAYLAFNLWLSDAPMPNTFYAKQAEYFAWQQQPLLYRLSVLLVQLLTGPSIILFPAMVAAMILAIRRRAWPMLAALLWSGGYLILYILRLPAYQHGRYLMPAMPILFLAGMMAFLEFKASHLFGRQHQRVLAVAQASLITLTVAFAFLGARSYGQDVGLIESEMVVTAKWIAGHVPPQEVVAAHDIGALGYFDTHPLIDLAGLVSPEVIPFIRDEARLAKFLNQQHANYLVAFPSFYPQLTRMATPVFSTGGLFAPALGEPNMTVYRWQAP